jgi:unsaturated rhamnogalacturonyl hydrolase
MTEKSGWGRGFKGYVAETAAVMNLALGGRSSKSYAAEGHWADALRRRPTYIVVQFGHNDMPGKGLDRETDLPTFRANMARYVDEARAAGAKPILITPLTRRYFAVDGRIHSDLGDYAEATRQVAAERNVPLIDLHAKSIELLDRLGPSVSPALGPLKVDGTLDKTHLNDAGSALFGALMAEELRRVVSELAVHIRAPSLTAPSPPWSARMADSVIKRTPDPLLLDATADKSRWDYTQGLVLKAILDLAQRTGDERYWKYVKAWYDGMIDADGTIHAYRLDEYSLDRINAGKPLFVLYSKAHAEKYRKAIETLRQQLRGQPRTADGGFWHKKRYPHQMWLDGLYMAAPFLTQYAKVFHEPDAFDDVITQFVLMEKHARDEQTGLLTHGWDESREQKWADPKTGRSPAFWGRAMGWYAMGLVETLDFVPPDHPRRGELIAILQRLAEAVTRVQDPKSGVWWQVVDQPGREGNYLESSVSTMFSFALMKSSRLGYIDAKYGDAGRRAYSGILKQFVEVDKDGLVTIHRVCQVAGLGGDPEKERYRDGTFEYYVNEKIRDNDPKAVGPFIFASMEMEGRP